jgi:hypothetical protein
MNKGIEIYSQETYIEEDLSNSTVQERFSNNYFWKVCNYVNQKFRDIGTFLDKEDVNDIELLRESREQGLEKED